MPQHASHPSVPPADTAHAAPPVPLLSRREFAKLASLACLAAACSADGSPTAPAASGTTLTGNTLTVPLSANPSLTQTNGMILVSSVRVLVFRLSSTEYGALSAICTHEQCTVSSFDGSRLTCPCHGSRFSTTGAVLNGPATAALRRYPATFDATAGTVTVDLS